MYFELNNLEVTRCLTFETNAQSLTDTKSAYIVHELDVVSSTTTLVRFINDVKFARRPSGLRFG